MEMTDQVPEYVAILLAVFLACGSFAMFALGILVLRDVFK